MSPFGEPKGLGYDDKALVRGDPTRENLEGGWRRGPNWEASRRTRHAVVSVSCGRLVRAEPT